MFSPEACEADEPFGRHLSTTSTVVLAFTARANALTAFSLSVVRTTRLNPQRSIRAAILVTANLSEAHLVVTAVLVTAPLLWSTNVAKVTDFFVGASASGTIRPPSLRKPVQEELG